MSSASNELRRYHIQRTVVDGERFVQIVVHNKDAQLVTRDHFNINEARSFAAELVLAVEG